MASDVWVKEGRQTFCEERRKHFIGHCPPDLWARARTSRKNSQGAAIEVSPVPREYDSYVQSQKKIQNRALLIDVLCFHINKKVQEIRPKN